MYNDKFIERSAQRKINKFTFEDGVVEAVCESSNRRRVTGGANSVSCKAAYRCFLRERL